jgi:hypothetical protein
VNIRIFAFNWLEEMAELAERWDSSDGINQFYGCQQTFPSPSTSIDICFITSIPCKYVMPKYF